VLLRCQARAATQGAALDPACTGDIDAALADAFAAAEADGDCTATGSDDVISALHTFHNSLTSMLVTGTERDRCAGGKLRAAARRAKVELRCRRVAAKRSTTPDAACLDKAQSGLLNGFARRDGRGDCATTDDAAAVEDLISDFLLFAAAQIDGTGDAPAPTGLAAVVNGAVVELTWTAPDPGSGLTEAVVLRKLNADPTGASDPGAELIFDGTGESATDDVALLLPDTASDDRNYHYAVFGCDGMGACEPNGSHTTLALTVRQALVVGGYTIHFRHAAADVCSDQLMSMVPEWWKRCDADCTVNNTATARQLNNAGRADATAIGDAFTTLGIPVGRVITSEFCRNFETAQLMDFGPPLEYEPDITYYVYDEPNRCNNSFALLAQTPIAGTNTALIGHAGFSGGCVPLSSLAWGEAAIFKPDGMGGTLLIDRVLAGGWLSLP
jgi:hypothetical protein